MADEREQGRYQDEDGSTNGPPAPVSTPIDRDLSRLFSEWTTLTHELPELANKNRHDLILSSFGVAILTIAMVLNLIPFVNIAGTEVALLSTPEFVVMFASGTLMLICGAVVRIFLYKSTSDYSRNVGQTLSAVFEKKAGEEPELNSSVRRVQSSPASSDRSTQ